VEKLCALHFKVAEAQGFVSDRDNTIAVQKKRLNTLDLTLSDRDHTIAEQEMKLAASTRDSEKIRELEKKLADSLFNVTDVSKQLKDAQELHENTEAAWNAAVEWLVKVAEAKNTTIAELEKDIWHLSAQITEAEKVVDEQNAAILSHVCV
jgi:chromosome segregation ATPase